MIRTISYYQCQTWSFLAPWRQNYWAVRSVLIVSPVMGGFVSWWGISRLIGLFAPHKKFSDPLESQSYSWNIHSRYSKFHQQYNRTGTLRYFHSVLRWNGTPHVEHLHKLRLKTGFSIFPAQRACWDPCNRPARIIGKPGRRETRLGRWGFRKSCRKSLGSPDCLFIEWRHLPLPQRAHVLFIFKKAPIYVN